MLTAHGGALGTGRNTKEYFDKMAEIMPDAIEVDLRSKGGKIYCSHNPHLNYNDAIPLEFVFEYVKKHGMKVNCDLKERRLLKRVIEIAKAMKAEKYLIFTGAISKRHLKYADCGEIYVNFWFYIHKRLRAKNLASIWKYIKSYDCPHIKGLNIPYATATEELVKKARELAIPLSIYTVDDPAVLQRLIVEQPSNITTNLIDVARQLQNELNNSSGKN